ncbi:MAG TPA: helix-turn-helix domain-containing protein, partial [Longimicrobiaceae bacterium]|nr:helix-turn-helix domain-containing protein [Longimicrobiaceae bacterium]
RLRSSRGAPAAPGGGAMPTLAQAVARAQSAVEERLIRDALQQTGGSRTRTAELLGISRKTLFNKIQELGIEPGDG